MTIKSDKLGSDEPCPECKTNNLFETIHGWWKCRNCFYSESQDKHKKRTSREKQIKRTSP